MSNTDSAAESRSHLHLHRVLEDEYVLMHGPLPKAYPWLFLLNHITRAEHLANKLQDRDNPVSNHLRGELRRLENEAAPESRRGKEAAAESQLLRRLEGEAMPFPHVPLRDAREREKLTRALAGLLNRLLEDTLLYDEKVFGGVPPSCELKDLIDWLTATRENEDKVSVGDVARLNRLLLEHAYPDDLAKVDDGDMKQVPAEIREKLRGGGEISSLQQSEQQSLYAVRLAAIYSLLHKAERSALCLSGGGIRSATFNLGVLQGLARHGLLPQFDYLSTVSGGGYIGSWLSSWIYRERGGAAAVSRALGKKPDSALEPEPEPVDWLRDYSNHQTPRVGVLSADFWTLVGVYLRNLFLNWLSFIPLLMAALMLPRIGVAMVGRPLRAEWQMPVLLLGFLAVGVSAFYTAVSLPSSGKLKFTASLHFRKCVMPLVASAILFDVYWVSPDKRPLSARHIIGGTMAVGLAGVFAYIGARIRRRYNPRCYGPWKMALLVVGALTLNTLASWLTGLLGWHVLGLEAWRLVQGPDRDARIFVTFGVPVFLFIYVIGGTLCAGFTSRWTGEDDQEWWARSGACIFLFIVGWVALCGLVLFMPEYLFASLDNLERSWNNIRASTPAATLGLAATVIGVVSGLFTLLAGFSNKTRARSSEAGSVPFLQSASRLAAPVFFGFLIVVIVAATNYLIVGFTDVTRLAVGWYQNPQTNILPDWLAQTVRLPDWLFRNLDFAPAVHVVPAPGNDSLRYPQVEGFYFLSHKYFLEAMTLRQCLVFFFTLVGFGWLMGMIIDSNKFSLHSYYGNRLKRTYLGASRDDREGNKFTGFDNCDNIQMHELRPTWIHRKSFKSPRRLDDVIKRVKRHSHGDTVSTFIHERLLPVTLFLLDAHDPDRGDASNRLRSAFIHELNRLVEEETFPVLEPERMHEHAAALVERGAQGEARVYLNRLILQCAYSREMNEYSPPKLFHVVNMALNLAWSDKLAWQERKAETFTASPLHTGNLWLGYRRSRHYGGESGISLGTAFTVSGAAGNPNMGYMLSSPLASFLMSMFNVRLGWWLGNPGPAGDRTFQRDVPRFVLGPVVQEALSLADDRKRYVYLSDGGHFENLGLYEMVLRRCKLIVVSDASTDADYSFESLGVAIRKIRIDLGVPIDFEEFRFAGPDDAEPRGRHCAVAKVRYSCVDEDGTDGMLVYIKPSLSGNEPRDVLNYRMGNKRFPQDPIADQFFDEPQFESYRMLGSHVVEDICGEESDGMTLRQFAGTAYAHWAEDERKYRSEWMKEWLGPDYRNGHHAAARADGAGKTRKTAKTSRLMKRYRMRSHARAQTVRAAMTQPAANGNNGGNGHKAPVKV